MPIWIREGLTYIYSIILMDKLQLAKFKSIQL